MLELHAISSNFVGCYGRPAALDQLADLREICVRVAPDELLLFDERHRLAEIEAELRALDAGGAAIDLSSAFSTWALCGDDRFEAFRRLSDIELPAVAGSAQGLLAQVPAKIVVRADELVLLVSSAVGHHVRQRVLVACADLNPSERDRVREVALEVSIPA